jgi:hypothetical protein
MARGWESKSVEEQQSEQQSEPLSVDETARRKRLTDAQRQRERQSLELQREHILNQRTSNPNRRAALESALADIEEKLKRMSS